MSSQTQIANMALSVISAKSTVENFDTEQSPEARQCRLWYTTARRQVLQAFDWGFAKKRVAASLSPDEPPEGSWSYSYVWPADAVHIRAIENPDGENSPAIPFAVETQSGKRVIFTDKEDAVLVYTYDLTDTSMFSPLFEVALANLLGFYMAPTLTPKRPTRLDAYNAYQSLVSNATAADANQGREKEAPEADWIAGR